MTFTFSVKVTIQLSRLTPVILWWSSNQEFISGVGDKFM